MGGEGAMSTVIPLVSGLAYRERLDRLPAAFEATLRAEPDNPYNPRAIAVVVSGEKVGYVATEVAREIYEAVASGGIATCRVKRDNYSSTTGVLGILELH